jgi:acylaminoacyl-peptidase
VIGQFPDIFTAAALRNPVISVGEISTSDIPDWGYAEFGLQYPVPIASSPPTISHSSSQSDGVVSSENATATPLGMVPEIYQKLYNASPLRFADKVTADVLLLIGKDDLRVAPTQGYGYYHTLKALRNGKGTAKGGSRVDMLVFDGESHPLNGVECERVCWEAARAWFLESTGEKGNSE